eukprot:GEMP01025886.1.p1 GENE.GEMP01025886.1~~GEMP01025886.1.p1  ORF type:complete len:461 (+),score=58.86 GEMP01025886.1:726-2108(+)
MAHESIKLNLFHVANSRKLGRQLSEGSKAELEFRQIIPIMKQRHLPLKLDVEIRFFALCGPDHYAIISKTGVTMVYHRDDPSEPASILTTITERGLFLHYNNWTSSIMIFFASAHDFPERTLRVRLIPLEQMVNDSWREKKYKPIAPQLQNLVLPYPGFFDLSTTDHVFLVWNEDKGNGRRRHMAAYSLRDYSFAFHVSDSGQDTDFRFTKESVTMLRVRLMNAPAPETTRKEKVGHPADPSPPSLPVHISISHLNKINGTRLHSPLHLRMLRNLGKITFLEEYNRFLMIKQEEGNLLVIDLRGWALHQTLTGNSTCHPCKSWFPRNVAYIHETNRFVCLADDELQVWRLGPDLSTFGCVFLLPPVSYALQNVRMHGIEHGVFFFMRQSNILGSYGEIRNLSGDDCEVIGSIEDDACTLELKPLCFCTPQQFVLAKYCPIRRELLLSYENVIYSYSTTGK